MSDFATDPTTGEPIVNWAAPRRGNIDHAWVIRCGTRERVPLCNRAGTWDGGRKGWKQKRCSLCERKVREGEWPR